MPAFLLGAMTGGLVAAGIGYYVYNAECKNECSVVSRDMQCFIGFGWTELFAVILVFLEFVMMNFTSQRVSQYAFVPGSAKCHYFLSVFFVSGLLLIVLLLVCKVWIAASVFGCDMSVHPLHQKSTSKSVVR